MALKASFAVEEEGFDDNVEEGNEENRLLTFINYIKVRCATRGNIDPFWTIPVFLFTFIISSLCFAEYLNNYSLDKNMLDKNRFVSRYRY